MAFYKGSVKQADFFDHFIGLLTTPPSGAIDPYWTQVQSGTLTNEGIILHSKGKSGTDNIYVQFRMEHSRIAIALMESYEPNPILGLDGTVTNETDTQYAQYNNSGIYDGQYPLHYWLSFDKDKIMLRLKGHENVSSNDPTFIWAGLPYRLSVEEDSTAAAIAIGGNYQNYIGNVGYARVVRNRPKRDRARSYMQYLKNWKSKGWHELMQLSHIYLEDESDKTEGIRSIMDCVHPLIDSPEGDFRDGDEITVGAKRYTILKIRDNQSYNCFPTNWLAVEQLT